LLVKNKRRQSYYQRITQAYHRISHTKPNTTYYGQPEERAYYIQCKTEHHLWSKHCRSYVQDSLKGFAPSRNSVGTKSHFKKDLPKRTECNSNAKHSKRCKSQITRRPTLSCQDRFLRSILKQRQGCCHIPCLKKFNFTNSHIRRSGKALKCSAVLWPCPPRLQHQAHTHLHLSRRNSSE